MTMTDEKFVSVLDRLERLLRGYQVLPVRSSTEKTVSYATDRMSHLLWMIGEMRGMDPAYPKAQRWLGFVQGALWDLGAITIDDLRAEVRE